jgi:hypothetical protein
MPYLDLDTLLLITARVYAPVLLAVVEFKRLENRFKVIVGLFFIVRATRKLTGTLLLAMVGNYLYDKGKRTGSLNIWFIPLSFFRAPYCQMAVVVLVLWVIEKILCTRLPRDKDANLLTDPQPQHQGPVRSTEFSEMDDDALSGLLEHLSSEIRARERESRQVYTLESIQYRPRRFDLGLDFVLKNFNGLAGQDVEAAMGATANFYGCKVFYRRFEIELFDLESPELEAKLDSLRVAIIETMRLAKNVDKDCTIQLGSFAILKHTGKGYAFPIH